MTILERHDTTPEIKTAFAKMFSKSPDFVGILNFSTQEISAANHVLEILIEKNHSDVKDLHSLISKADRPAFVQFCKNVQKHGHALVHVQIMASKREFFTFIHGHCLNDKEALIYLVDISKDTKSQRDKFREKWIQIFDHLFEDSKDIMNLYSLSTRTILRLNKRAFISLGYTSEEMQHLTIEQIYPPKELLKLGGIFHRLEMNASSEDEVSFYAKNGELHTARIRASVLEREPEVLCLVQTTELAKG